MPSSIQNESDNELIDNAKQCVDAFNAHPADYPGVTQQNVDDVKAFKDAFIPEVALSLTKQTGAKTQTQIKDAKRVPTESQLAMIRNLATAAHTTPAALTAMGFSTVSQPAPRSAARPIGRVDTSQRLQHTIHWTDEATPDNTERPRGTVGVRIYSKIDAPPPTDQANATSSPSTPPRPTSSITPAAMPEKWLITCSAGICATAPRAPGPKPSAPPSRVSVQRFAFGVPPLGGSFRGCAA